MAGTCDILPSVCRVGLYISLHENQIWDIVIPSKLMDYLIPRTHSYDVEDARIFQSEKWFSPVEPLAC